MPVPEQLAFHEDDLRDLRERPDEMQSVWSYIARVPEVRALHAARGIPDDVSWATLQDLPRHTHLDRVLHGSPGLRKTWWIEPAWEGLRYEVGRLQFGLDQPLLDVHIPETGPLTPTACDASLARAHRLFPGYDGARCRSWLLDPQLTDYLPSESNIVRFQRRFDLVDGGLVDDEHVLEFVFHRLDPDLDALPRETALQRAIVDHLRAGGHWYAAEGRLEL